MQAASKAHFDNCDFESGLEYIRNLTADAAEATKRRKSTDALTRLGQAMHALQDFYAHSNYVEIMSSKHRRFEDVPIVGLWRPDAARKLTELREVDGLVSGYVWWGFPKRCPPGTPTHDELAKDSLTTKSGRQATHVGWEGRNGFQAARELARTETLTYLAETLAAWPQLRDACGKVIPVAQQLDVRREPAR